MVQALANPARAAAATERDGYLQAYRWMLLARVLDDKWTAVTADGSCSAHFEHCVAVTKDGPMILPIGAGDSELEMLRIVARSGYRGPVGVLAQCFDHRALDGAYSAAFLRRVKEILETSDWTAELQ